MKRAFASLAFRLSLWLLLLSALPLIVVAFFVRRNVVNELVQRAADQSFQQAEINSVFISKQKATVSLAEFVEFSQPQAGIHFIVDRDGVYAAYPDGQKASRSIQEDYSPETVSAVLIGVAGSISDEQTGKILGYAPVPDTTWVDVVVITPDTIDRIVGELGPLSVLQIGASLVIVLILGGLVIWMIVGYPLRHLTTMIQQMGKGDFEYKLDSTGMDNELQMLADAFLQVRGKIKNQITSLETRVEEITRANASLQESEQHFRAIFDSTTDAIFVQSLETSGILDINQKFTELYGYSLEEAGALKVDDLNSEIPPYTQRSLLRWVRRARMHGSQSLEWQARAKDGHFFWVELSLRVAPVNGKECILVAARDINERKRAENMQVAVYRIFQSAQASQTFYELLSFIHGILEQLLPAKNFMVAFYDPGTDLFTYPYHADQYAPWPSIHRSDNRQITYVMRTAEPLLATPEVLERLGIEADADEKTSFVDWLGAPLQTSSGVLGVVAITNYLETARFSEQDKETFSFLSTQIALAVERKRAEDALRESEARWRTLMENTPQLILTINRTGEILFVNRTFQSFNREKMSGKSIFSYIPGTDNAKKQETLRMVFSDRSTAAFEISISRGEGDEGWFSCNISPVVDGGRVDMAIFNATDITDRKRAEAALRESEELYRRAIEAAGAVPYYREHQNNSFRFMGAGIFHISGYSNEEITPEIWDSLVEDGFMLGQASGLSLKEATRLAQAGKLKVWQCDYRIRTRDGRIRWVYDSSLGLAGPDGVSRGSIGIMQDISSRKLVEDALRQSEFKFRSIVEQLSEGFALVDENGCVLEWNPALGKMLGIEDQDVIGCDFMDIMARLTPPDLVRKSALHKKREAFNKALKTGKSLLFEQPTEIVMVTASGSKIYIEQTVFPISTESGFRVGALNRDITDQKRAEAEIRELNAELESRVIERTAQLEAANKELEAFSYSISHDLRAPLRAINGFSRILADLLVLDGADDARRYLGVIRDNAQQMGRLIDDLLSFSRLSRQPLKKLPLSPTELIDQVLVTLSPEQQGRQIDLIIDGLPICLGDSSLLKQVWMNLLSNALKFTRDCNPACIEIGSEQQSSEIIFFVKDNGTGFDMRYVNKLFGVFQRLHRPEDFEGTGVGLAIVQRIIRRHGGRVWAESELGKGASFYFSLPKE
jgi:PAS domain S-box-containing protein